MYRNNWFGGDGWTYYPVRVEISDCCPICGEKRGTPQSTRYCEDGEWYNVDNWKNPCGHLDNYKDCLIEANKIKNEKSEDIVSV